MGPSDSIMIFGITYIICRMCNFNYHAQSPPCCVFSQSAVFRQFGNFFSHVNQATPFPIVDTINSFINMYMFIFKLEYLWSTSGTPF